MKKDIQINYYSSLNIDRQYDSSFLGLNINILPWSKSLNLSDVIILFDYIISDDYL